MPHTTPDHTTPAHTSLPTRVGLALAALLVMGGCAPSSGEIAAGPQTAATPGLESAAEEQSYTEQSPATKSPAASASSTPDESSSSSSASTSATATASGKPGVRSNVSDGATDVPVSTLLTVQADGLTLDRVTVTSTASGRNTAQVGGAIMGSTWTADTRLDPSAGYTLTATATGADGRQVTRTTRFTTAAVPRSKEVFPTLSPVVNGPYGVAQPVVVQFDVPVRNKAEFERNMHVTATPAQAGSWGWLDDKTVHWRPQQYWKPGTTVKLDARLNGVDAGGGNFGQLNRSHEFRIGRKQSGTVDIANHTISWQVEGKPTRSWPMTAGKPGFTTRSGTKVVMEKAENIEMASETTGIPRNSSEGYNLRVAYALRVTDSGEFIHSAPWNAGNFGVRNASHGCVGMDEQQMYSLYSTAQVGDPVVFTGSERSLEAGNGWSDWNVSWQKWQELSALA